MVVLAALGLADAIGIGTAAPNPRAGPTAANHATPRLSSAVAGEPTSSHLMVATATDPATGGYWLVGQNGGVYSFGAPFYGAA